ncbi:hypothetical protein E2C01_026612 [Portunus trituberculatus]|uniref:Uncharacterized protein n=1 Tax=Portunus trituberculatus TaxID=210409 RepID=A0A5B7EJ26_PORTR|nr:hypothetical protein [Portunus trituberculatus]
MEMVNGGEGRDDGESFFQGREEHAREGGRPGFKEEREEEKEEEVEEGRAHDTAAVPAGVSAQLLWRRNMPVAVHWWHARVQNRRGKTRRAFQEFRGHNTSG